MAENTELRKQSPEAAEVLDKAKGFWDNYSKIIIYGGTAAILLMMGWIGYKKLIKEPKELQASETVFMAEGLFDKMATSGFSKDSVNIVLNGGTLDGNNITGLLKVISKYDGTLAANRAKYMTGACYLQIKEFDKAIKYLKDFNDNGAHQLGSKAYVMMGHAYAEKNNNEEALSNYKKAAELNEKDESVTPDALMLYAAYAESVKKNEDAIAAYKKLKENFPNYSSVSNGDVDKRMARLGELN